MALYSLIVPAFFAEETIEELVVKSVNFFESKNHHYEIIIVDDGSKDKTWEKIVELKKRFNHIKGIKLNRNFGQHNATLCGILESKGDFIITIDDDLEYLPEDISMLIQNIHENKCDVVYGISDQDKRPRLRRWASKMYKFWSKMDAHSNQKGSSFRIINGKLRESFSDHQFKFLFIDEILLWYSDSIQYVKVPTYKSKKKQSTYSGSKLANLATDLIMYSSDGLLKSMIWIGVLIAGVNGFLILYYLLKKIIIGSEMGFTSIIICILFSTGIIMLCLGVIGLYLGHIYQNSFHQPSYFIKEKI